MESLTKLNMSSYSYGDWAAYFAQNTEKRLSLCFAGEKSLPKEEATFLFPSIRAFQKGEGSDGKCLVAAAEAFSQQQKEPDYRRAILLFVKEENFHSLYLKEFLKYQQTRTAKQNFLDTVFRRLRQLGKLKCEITVLVTAEIIALSYYSALKNCTSSPCLKGICQRMLQDELPHVAFQSYTLAHFKIRRATLWARKVLMACASIAVWLAFPKIFRAGGYSFGKFWRENFGYLAQSIQQVKNLQKNLEEEKEWPL